MVYRWAKIDDAEIRALCRDHQRTGCIESRNRVVESFLPLARLIARKYTADAHKREDYTHEAVFALMDCVRNYDTSHKVPFGGYASRCINLVLCTVRYRDTMVAAPYWARSESPKLTPERRAYLADAKRCREPVVPLESSFESWHPVDHADPARAAEIGDEISMVKSALSSIASEGREIVARRYGLDGREPMTAVEIAGADRIDRGRVRRVLAESLATLAQRVAS
jgi:RNA polymerase sigma factor (sigma-70 family)